MTIDKDNLIFGETLTINIRAITYEAMQNVTLDLYVPEGLDFTAMINKTECEGKSDCKTSHFEVKADDKLITPLPFHVEKIHFPMGKQINLVPDSEWNTNFTFSAHIQVTNIGTSDVQQQEFVSSMLRYFGKNDDHSQSATIKLASSYYTLVPVKVKLNLGSADIDSSTVNVYLTSSMNVTVEAEVDPRGLPILIQLQLPSDTRMPKPQKAVENCLGYKYNGEGINCTTTESIPTSPQKLIELTRRTAVLDKGFSNQYPIALPINESIMNDTVPILLKRSDSPENYCKKTCKINLTLTVEMNDKVANIGDQLTFAAKVFYGQNLNLSTSTDPGKMNIIGPDLKVEITSDKTKDIEAGEEIKFTVSLRHSEISTDDVIISHVSFTYCHFLYWSIL